MTPTGKFMIDMLRKWGASEYAGFLACPIGFVLVQYVIFIAKLGRADAKSHILITEGWGPNTTQIDMLTFRKSGRLIYYGDLRGFSPLRQTLSNVVRNKVRGSLEPSMLKDYWDTWPAQMTWKQLI